MKTLRIYDIHSDYDMYGYMRLYFQKYTSKSLEIFVWIIFIFWGLVFTWKVTGYATYLLSIINTKNCSPKLETGLVIRLLPRRVSPAKLTEKKQYFSTCLYFNREIWKGDTLKLQAKKNFVILKSTIFRI